MSACRGSFKSYHQDPVDCTYSFQGIIAKCTVEIYGENQVCFSVQIGWKHAQ